MQTTTVCPTRFRASCPVCAPASLLCTFIALGLLSGCATTSSTRESDKATEEEIHTFESTFHPSDFDPMRDRPVDRTPRKVDTTSVMEEDAPTAPPNMEMVQGFRVQVFSTTSIDAARAKRLEFEAAFPNEWFYLEYHAPTYKLRAGNFQTRFEAERFARLLTDQGHREAWTVPEKVFKSPGLRPALIPTPE